MRGRAGGKRAILSVAISSAIALACRAAGAVVELPPPPPPPPGSDDLGASAPDDRTPPPKRARSASAASAGSAAAPTSVAPPPAVDEPTRATEPAATARATGLTLGARSGYMLPFGSIDGAAPITKRSLALGDYVSGAVPLVLDVGGKPLPSLYVGGTFQYAFASTASYDASNQSGCAPGASCSAHDVRLGLRVELLLAPDAKIDPWLGAGVGYEWLGFDSSGALGHESVSYRGVDFLELSAGADLAAAAGLALGPWASLGMGEYASRSGTLQPAAPLLPTTSLDGDVQSAKLHAWLTLGLRVVYTL